MAVDHQERTCQVGGDSAVAELRTLPEAVCKQTLADWNDSAALYIRQQLFDKKQFVTDDGLIFGATIQKLVCSHINIRGKKEQECSGMNAEVRQQYG
jgi:hypothetical protein